MHGLNHVQRNIGSRKKKKGENAKKFLVEKKKEKIGLDLMILLDKIKIGPGRDFTQKKMNLKFGINK
jgi:hypothetical protein